MEDEIIKQMTESSRIKNKTAEKIGKKIWESVKAIIESYKHGGKTIWMGNGGSAADAQHLSGELVSKFRIERKGLPSLSLATNTSILTAIGNDYTFEKIFEKQIEAHCKKEDVVIGISTSGNSKNVILGIIKAKEIGAKIIGLTGEGGGKMKEYCDILLDVASNDTPRIQETHITIGHIICELVEKILFGKTVFLDRDGTINEEPYFEKEGRNYAPRKLEQIKIKNGVIEGLKKLKDYRLIIISNQSGISKKYFTKEVSESITKKIIELLSKEGIKIERSYYCSHKEEDNCGCRKPKIGMITKAIKELNIELENSYIIGNSKADEELGKALGIKTIILGKTAEDMVEAAEKVMEGRI